MAWNGRKLSQWPTRTTARNNKPSDQDVWLVYKLRGELVTASDPHGRSTVFQRRRRYLPKHAVAVGRLDFNTEGLLIVTTDGHYSRTLEPPRNHYHRVYQVRVHGRLEEHKLTAIRKGSVRVGGITYGPMRVDVETKKKTNATNQWLKITCTEGKNRQIRKVLQHLGCKYTRTVAHRLDRKFTSSHIRMNRIVFIALHYSSSVTVTCLIRISFGDYKLDTVIRSKMPAIRVPIILREKHRRQGRMEPSRAVVPEEDKEEKTSAVQWMRAGQ